jgi:dUTP pyrophosphatase
MQIELKILDKEFYGRKCEQSQSLTLGENYIVDGYLIDQQKLPTYATSGSAGIDLVATKNYTIAPQERVKIRTGIAIHIGSLRHKIKTDGSHRANYMGMIVPRSGLGTKGLVLANTIGIIDEDYQGEIILSAWNSNKECYERQEGFSHRYLRLEHEEKFIEIKAGDKIAQLIFMPVLKAQWWVVEEFTTNTDRGVGGFGSTDK